MLVFFYFFMMKKLNLNFLLLCYNVFYYLLTLIYLRVLIVESVVRGNLHAMFGGRLFTAILAV